MNNSELIRTLKDLDPAFLVAAVKKVNGLPTYVCPACGNGSGKDGDGIVLDPTCKRGKRWKCFRCGINEDVIGLWRLQKQEADFRRALRDLKSYFNIQEGG